MIGSMQTKRGVSGCLKSKLEDQLVPLSEIRALGGILNGHIEKCNLLMSSQSHHLHSLCSGRFKQVQTLAVTADAFFCLYSYVSKTPVQKFTPSNMFWNCDPTDVPSIRILAPEPEPHSPRERLRKAISKMCLYTGSRDRLLPSHTNPKRNSLDQVVWEVMDRVKGEKLGLQQGSGHGQAPQEESVPPGQNTKLFTSSIPCAFCPKEETQGDMCCAHALARAGPQCDTDSAQIRRELWGLQAIKEKPHSAEKESPWERKGKARKSLFQSPPLDKNIKSLDLSIIQKKRKQSQARHELHQSLTQQLQGASDFEQVSVLEVRERQDMKSSVSCPEDKGKQIHCLVLTGQNKAQLENIHKLLLSMLIWI